MNQKNRNVVSFKSGEYLFYEKTPGDFFYVIEEGQVEIFKTKSETEKIPLAVLGAGQCIGEFAVLDGGLRSASARALTDVSVVRIGSMAVAQQMKELPTWFVAITKNLVNRLRTVDEVLRRNGFVDGQLVETIAAVEENERRRKGPPVAEKSDNTPNLPDLSELSDKKVVSTSVNESDKNNENDDVDIEVDL